MLTIPAIKFKLSAGTVVGNGTSGAGMGSISVNNPLAEPEISYTFDVADANKKVLMTTDILNTTENGPLIIAIKQQVSGTNEWQTLSSTEVNSSGIVELEAQPINTETLSLTYSNARSGIAGEFKIKYLKYQRKDVLISNKVELICSTDPDFDGDYRFGFNGQEKDNEIAGIGNHNTALFWEYDTRLGRRWNLDPVDQINISNYACFGNNPILMTDELGDLFGIKGFGSSSDQRKSASLFAKENKGEVKDKWKKSINVKYQTGTSAYFYNESKNEIQKSFGVKMEKQNFNYDGSLYDNTPQIKSYTPSILQVWGENESFVGKFTYGLIDDPYVFIQGTFTKHFQDDVRHLDGKLASSNDIIKAFAGTATDLIPIGKYGKSLGVVTKIEVMSSKNLIRLAWRNGTKARELLAKNVESNFNSISQKAWDKTLNRLDLGSNIIDASKKEK